MNRVVLDADLKAKLNGATAGVEITDEAGNPVGHFMTHEAFVRLLEVLQPPMTTEEIADARREMLTTGGLTTAEILQAIDAAIRERRGGR